MDATITLMPSARGRNPDAVRFGQIIHTLRLQRGWTLQYLAGVAKISAGYIGLLERGRNLPTISVVIALADALGVDPGELVRLVAAPTAVPPPLPNKS